MAVNYYLLEARCLKLLCRVICLQITQFMHFRSKECTYPDVWRATTRLHGVHDYVSWSLWLKSTAWDLVGHPDPFW